MSQRLRYFGFYLIGWFAHVKRTLVLHPLGVISRWVLTPDDLESESLRNTGFLGVFSLVTLL